MDLAFNEGSPPEEFPLPHACDLGGRGGCVVLLKPTTRSFSRRSAKKACGCAGCGGEDWDETQTMLFRRSWLANPRGDRLHSGSSDRASIGTRSQNETAESVLERSREDRPRGMRISCRELPVARGPIIGCPITMQKISYVYDAIRVRDCREVLISGRWPTSWKRVSPRLPR
ncbi:hypothetical protein LX32DRAFT_459608 [Colletotrichum zoysiae]|uniref:Uncharacterized protein n=1 Tax=Colletotrichum zoysiae TaxID=1216348 RepID=A0AAD9M315_9PEZI|nr:hypothetical protein LX32DRAFT_459608 [Colletotrichum zoysiae]